MQGAGDYAQGIITLQNAPNAAYSVTADVYTEQRTVKQMALTTNADLVGGTIGPCQAGTVLIEVTATFSESESKSYWDWSAVSGFGQSARRGTRTHSSRRAYAHAISDDGNGGLVLYGKKLPGATINYVSGTFSIPLAALARDARHIRYQDHQIDNKATPISISVVDDGGPQRKYSASVSAATVSYIAAGAATRHLTLTLSNNSQAANVLQNKPWPRQCLLNSWVFRLLAPVPRSKLVPPAIKAAIVAAIRSFGGYIDLDCLVSWLLFSGNTAADLDELCRQQACETPA